MAVTAAQKLDVSASFGCLSGDQTRRRRPTVRSGGRGGAPPQLTAGERWTHEALDRLRARRFTPAAWVEFLAASLARARRVRRLRPGLVRQSRRWGAAGLLAALPLGRRPVLWWAGWWAMCDWHLGMVETRAGAARPLAAADALTLVRLWLAPVVRSRPGPALVVAAAVTDVLDGALARRAGPTRFGRDLDSAADASFQLMALAGLADRQRLPRRALAAEQARVVTQAAVTLAAYFGDSARPAVAEQRTVAAALTSAGMLAAAAGGRPAPARARAAEALLAAGAGGRLLLGLRALGQRGG